MPALFSEFWPVLTFATFCVKKENEGQFWGNDEIDADDNAVIGADTAYIFQKGGPSVSA